MHHCAKTGGCPRGARRTEAAARLMGEHRIVGGMLLAVSCLLWPTVARAQTGISVKAGPAFALDNDFLNDANVGWSIQTTARQPIARPTDFGFVFIDLGGSFLSVSGEGEKRQTPGSFATINTMTGTRTTTPLTYLNDTQLVDVRRGSADVAIGWQQENRGLQFDVRGGGRVGHIHGTFRDVPSAASQALIGGLGMNETYALVQNYRERDTFGGMFFGGGVVLTKTWFNPRVLGPTEVRFSADGEFSYDWIDFKNFQDDVLQSGAVLLNMTLRR